MRLKRILMGGLVTLLLAGGMGTAGIKAQGGPFNQQIENFWRLISTGGRTFTLLKATTATITTLNLTTLNLTTFTTTTLGVSGTAQLASTATFSWSTGAVGAASDVFFRRSAAKTLTIDTDGAGGNLTAINLTATSVSVVAGATIFTDKLRDVGGILSITAGGSIQAVASSVGFAIGNNLTVLSAPLTGQFNLTNNPVTAGVGFDVLSNTLKVRNTAQNAYVAVDALSLSLGGTNAFSGTGGGNLTINGFLLSVPIAASNLIQWNGRGSVGSTANGLIALGDNGASFGPLFNTGTAAPTATTCGTGAMTAHSSNTAGEVTATGATTCTVTFGTPNFTNTPFCVIEDETTIAATRISAISVSAFTVTGITAGDKFMFHCIGGI